MAKASNAQLVSALYIAVYNRAPETSGFNFWVETLDQGVPLQSMAAQFVTHEVFSQNYGELSNLGLVEAFYKNILGGDGDQQGVDFWVQELETKPVGTVLAEFLTAALEIDLSTSAGLSAADWIAAQKRQDMLTNKAEVAIHYAEQMGELSELTGDLASADIVNDPKYQQAVQALASVTEDAATVVPAKQAIDAMAPEKEIVWQTPLMRVDFDDEAEIYESTLQVNLSHSFTEAPLGPKELGNISFEPFDLNGAELMNGGIVGNQAALDWIHVNQDVVMQTAQVDRLFFASHLTGEGFIEFQAQKEALTFHFEGDMAGRSALNAAFSDNVQELSLWVNHIERKNVVDLDLSIGKAEGLNTIDLTQLHSSSTVGLDLSEAEVAGAVTVRVNSGQQLTVVGSDDTAETIHITGMGFNQLRLEQLDFTTDQDKIQFGFGGVSFDSLQLTQQENSVMVKLAAFQSAGQIELVGAKLEDLSAEDFVF